jgi:hypothetical protein
MLRRHEVEIRLGGSLQGRSSPSSGARPYFQSTARGRSPVVHVDEAAEREKPPSLVAGRIGKSSNLFLFWGS